MHTNIEFDELIHSVEKAYLADISKLVVHQPCSSDLIFFLRCILANNFFEFNIRYYKQIIDAAMGARPHPKSKVYVCKIQTYLSRQMKTAILFDGSQDEINEFFTIENSCLRFTLLHLTLVSVFNYRAQRGKIKR